jgi:hypothetical protein
MDTGSREIVSAFSAILDRHDQRRGCRVPTVSTLVGPVALGLHSINLWGETRGRPVVFVQLEQPTPEAAVIPWVSRLAKTCNLNRAAVGWLAHRLSQRAESLDRSLRTMTHYEVGMFLDSVLPLGAETGIEQVVRCLIERVSQNESRELPKLAPTLNSLLDGHGPLWLRLFRTLGELVIQERLPVLVLTPSDQDMFSLEKATRLVTDLASSQPCTALVLLVEAALFDTYMAQAPISRVKALLRESVVMLPFPEASFTPVSTRARESSLLESQVSANRDPSSKSRESIIGDRDSEMVEFDDDPARSAAERFLFEQLESVPQTTGLFALNSVLNFCFGSNRWIEVDLASRALKLVVEIDGYYHFQDPTAYRRDRRKDLELQKHGYLVVRVLASDVVERLEDVKETILAAVAFRRAVR